MLDRIAEILGLSQLVQSVGGIMNLLPWAILVGLWLFPSFRTTFFGWVDPFNPLKMLSGPKVPTAAEIAAEVVKLQKIEPK